MEVNVQISCPETIWSGPAVIVAGIDVAVGVEEGMRGVDVREGVGDRVKVGVEVGIDVGVVVEVGMRVGTWVVVGLAGRKSLPICPGILQLKSKKQRMVRKMKPRWINDGRLELILPMSSSISVSLTEKLSMNIGNMNFYCDQIKIWSNQCTVEF